MTTKSQVNELRAAYRPAAHLTDAQLLAQLWRTTTDEQAASILIGAGSLRELCIAGSKAMSAAKRKVLDVALELARRHYQQEARDMPYLDSPSAARQFLVAQLRDLQHEVFCCLFLDNRHRLIAYDELFRGTIDGASVHPREVVKQALDRNAAAVILAHNHPSGVAEPSKADELITLRLKDALGMVDIRVLDHLIIGASRCVSLAERGLI
jgi:DNA repair protein RadC